MLEQILLELLNEAATGTIIIDNDPFNIGFNTIIYDGGGGTLLNTTKNDNIPTLLIKNKPLFLRKLAEYINQVIQLNPKMPSFVFNKEINTYKIIIAYLFANANDQDFINPTYYIERCINYFKDDTFNSGLTDEVPIFQNSNIKIDVVKQSIYMETPFRLDITITKGQDLIYHLPSISYGITLNEHNDKICYIYSVQNIHTNQSTNPLEIKYQKQIARLLYKINDGINTLESEEYHQYKQTNTGEYVENISDVSPSAIASLTLFFSLLQKENIKDIRSITYLPVRYQARERKINESTKTNQEKEMMHQQHYAVQRNITDKFIRSLRRLTHHLDNLSIHSFPYEITEYMQLYLEPTASQISNEMLSQIYYSIDNIYHKKL